MATLCVPNLGDELRKADVVGVELVHPDENADSGSSEGPCADRADKWELAWVDVVHQKRVKPDVTVHHQAHAEDGVEGRVRGRADRERCDGGGHERGGEEALERPVVRPVRL